MEERSASSVCDDVPDDDEMSRDEAYRRESALVGDVLPADNDGGRSDLVASPRRPFSSSSVCPGHLPPGSTPRTCGGTDHCGQT